MNWLRPSTTVFKPRGLRDRESNITTKTQSQGTHTMEVGKALGTAVGMTVGERVGTCAKLEKFSFV